MIHSWSILAWNIHRNMYSKGEFCYDYDRNFEKYEWKQKSIKSYTADACGNGIVRGTLLFSPHSSLLFLLLII